LLDIRSLIAANCASQRDVPAEGKHGSIRYNRNGVSNAGTGFQIQYGAIRAFLSQPATCFRHSAHGLNLEEESRMDLRKLKKLIDLVQESGVAELEVKEGEEAVRITRVVGSQQTVYLPQGGFAPAPAAPPVPAALAAQAEAAAALAAAEPATIEGQVVKTPMVRTYYRSSRPGGKVFVDIGESVAVGDVLCIIEAMKLMNEIEADSAGVIKQILAENGQAVEYGQPLFVIG
jgi:acetyl-CoA carboxylase biotin carboxyl carrier protein